MFAFNSPHRSARSADVAQPLNTWITVPTSAAFALIASLTVSAHADIFVFSHILEASQEVPPTPSPATGECTVTVNDVERTVEVDCTYEGLLDTILAAHIHHAPPGVNGPFIMGLIHSGETSGEITGFGVLEPAQIEAILAGNAYINVHSFAFDAGEIRGQIVNDIVPTEPMYVGGLLHESLGQATLLGQDTDGNGGLDRLTISNIGDSGEDGVRVVLAENVSELPGLVPTGWSGRFHFGELPDGGEVIIAFVHGDPAMPNVLASFHFAAGANTAVTLAEACADCSVNLKLVREGVVITDLDGDGSLDVIATGAIGNSKDDGVIATFTWRQLSGPLAGFIQPVAMEKDLRFTQDVTLHVSGMTGGEIEVIEYRDGDNLIVTQVVDPGGVESPPDSVFVTASNMDPNGDGDITIRDEQFIVQSRGHGDGEIVITSKGKNRGASHITGTQLCDADNVCISAIEISNLGESGNDGVTFGDAKDVGGLPTESDALPGNVQPGRKIQLDPVILDLSGDGISTLKIESEWCGSFISDPDQACGDSITMYSWLEATGGPDGEASVHVDFSQLDTNEMVVSIHDSTGNAQIAPAVAITVATNLTVAALLPGVSVQIDSVTDASHAMGEHTPAFIWRFAQPVSINIDTVGTFTGDELRLSPGNGNGNGEAKVIVRGWDPKLSITGASGGGGGSGGAIHITGIESAGVGFTEGHVFGFPHTATDGAALAIAPPMPNIPVPLLVSSSSGSGSVAIDVGFAAEGFGFTSLSQCKASATFFATAAQPAPAVTQLAFGPCPPPPDEDPLCDNLPPGLDYPGFFAVDLSELGATSYTIEIKNPDVIVSDVQANPPTMVLHSGGGGGGTLTVSGTLVVSGGSLADFTEPRYILRAGVPFNVQAPDGTIVLADEIHITAHGIEQELSVHPSLSYECLPEVGDEVLVTILDEWVELFDLEHRASDVGRLSIVNEDIDDDSVDNRVIALGNPSSGGDATVASVHSEKGSFGGMVGIGHQNFATSFDVPDPCAGKPEPCESFPNGASLVSRITLLGDGAGNISQVEVVFNPSGGSDGEIDLFSNFVPLVPDTLVFEVLHGETVITTIPNYAGNVVAWREGSDAVWADGVNYLVSPGDGGASNVIATLSWDEPLHFAFDTGGPRPETFEGDGLRLTALGVEGISGVINHSLTTIKIPEVLITDMAFDDEPKPIPCPADLDNSGAVGVSDLLLLLAAWGPNANHPADLDNNGSVGVSDLLLLLAAWGACP